MQHETHYPASSAMQAKHAHCTTNSSHAQLTTSATIHCLTGCAIGELGGLIIGVSLGLSVWTTITLATSLAFITGFLLGLWPLVKEGTGWFEAFRIIWLGEVISISVMEIVMNYTDYHVGGMTVSSIFHYQFWLGYILALPAGFIAAWPVNYWLLKRNIKKPCH
jgi:hypothetical protein